MRTATAFTLALLIFSGCRKPVVAQDTPGRQMAIAWQKTIEVEGLRHLTVGPRTVIVMGSESGAAAYAIEDGRLVWREAVIPTGQPMAMDRLLVVPTAEGIEALDHATGQPAWRVTMDATSLRGLDAAGDLIVVRVAAGLRALRQDGTEAWQKALPAEPATRVVRAGDTLVVGLSNAAIVAMDPATGVTAWSATVQSTPSALVAIGDQLFAPGANGVLYAFRIKNGMNRIWQHRAVAAVGAPAIGDRLVFYALIDNTVKAFDRRSGARRWSSPLDSRPVAGPLLLGGDVIVPLANGSLAQLPAATGRTPAPANTPPPELISRMSTAAVSQGSLYAIVTAANDTTTLIAWRVPR